MNIKIKKAICVVVSAVLIFWIIGELNTTKNSNKANETNTEQVKITQENLIENETIPNKEEKVVIEPTKKTTIDSVVEENLPQQPVNEISPTFDNKVMTSVLQIQIRNNSGELVEWGTGMSIGGNGVLTNYHVVKTAVLYPNDYKVYGCLTKSLNINANCTLLLSLTPKLFGQSARVSTYDPQRDLAMLFLDKIKISNQWKSWEDVPISNWEFGTIYLPSYLKNYQQINIGDRVYAIGYPDYGNGKSVQVDGQVLSIATDSYSGQPLVVSDYEISFGNSGGPVFNSRGETVGVTVQCYADSNKKCIKGLYIPLQTVHWWITNYAGLKAWTWEGKTVYRAGSITDKTIGESLCLLRKNAFYDASISPDSCTCKSGFSKSTQGGDCDMVNMKQEILSSWEMQKKNIALCQSQYGVHTTFNVLYGITGSGDPCECMEGYAWNSNKTMCE